MAIVVAPMSGDVMAWHGEEIEKVKMVTIPMIVGSDNEGGSTGKGRWQQRSR